MGIITTEQTDRLYWLGRYSERVYTTLRLYSLSYDKMIDQISEQYEDFCKNIDIPNVYESKEDFNKKYPFDKENSNSIISNLIRAYDNAVVLREEIGSETLAYIQLAIYDMKKAEISKAPLIEFQNVIDNLLAFWGIVDDNIYNEQIRNIIKAGKRIERVDLYARLKLPKIEIEREVHRMTYRLEKSGIKYKKNLLESLNSLVKDEYPDYYRIVSEVENILE